MDLMTKALGLLEDRADLDGDGDLDCLEDDDEKQRKEGNKFQNENVYNRLLPYDISAECQDHLMRIKASLAKCIQLDQETVYYWFIDLEKFVDLYGLAFTKEEHIYFVRMQYEFMTANDSMDFYQIAYVARSFSRLMRKRYLISAEELQLDWRPFYETYERLLYSETESLGLRFVPDSLEQNFSQAIRLARPHFPVEATQEMLDEWRPMLSPFGSSIQKAVTYLNLFLPTTLPVEHHDKGFKLWFDEIMKFWLGGKVSVTTYESKITQLLSRLSSDCMGYIDWDPYIPGIFNHFKASLNLNGGIIIRTCSRGRQTELIDVGPCVHWIVYMISKDNSCLDHISKLFKAIESFYHPSNTDRRWHAKLQQFLYKLPASYVKRLYRERYKKDIWSKRISESHKLTEEHTTRLVNSIMPILLTSMFNQSGISSAALAFRDLSVLRPEIVIPPLLERLYGSYETLIEPHRLLSSINCMASVVPAMVTPCKNFPEGPSHVVPLLLNSLPGIDSNDMRKCIAVFRFIATLAAHIQMKDYSYLVDERPDLTYEQQQLCLSTSQFDEFLMQFLDKCFTLIENVATASFANLDQEAQSKNGEEGIIEASISSVTLSILAQASTELKQATLDKLYTHVTRHMFDIKTRGKAIATLCLACAKSLPEETLAKFVPHFGRLILALTDNDEVFQESILDEELLFSLLLMSEIVRCNSPYLLDHKNLIFSVLNRALKLTSKDGYMLGCAILRHLLRALTNITCSDWSNIDPEDLANQATGGHWPFDNWGHTTHIKDLKMNWEVPGPESVEFAQQLIDVFLRSAVTDLLSWSQSKQQLAREHVQRSLHIILSSLVGASSVLPPVDLPTVALCPYEIPFIPMIVHYTGTDAMRFSDGTNIRTFLLESMKQILLFVRSTNEDDTKSLTLICEIFCTAIGYFGYNKTEFRLTAQRIKSLKSGTQNKLLGTKRHLRYLLVERVAQQHRAMLLNKGQPNFTNLHLDIFNCVFDLAQSHYIEVRVLAQDSVYSMLHYFPFSEHILLPLLVKELRSRDIEHNKFKGLLHLILGKRSYNSIAIDPTWSFLRDLWPAIVDSPHSKKPSIVRLLDRICNIVQKSFDTFELTCHYKESLKKLAAELWTSNFVDLEKYQPPEDKLIELVRAEVQKRNKKRVEDYEQLVLKLVEQIEDPHLHWHRKMVAYNLITYLMRDDHLPPLPALRLFITSLINERLTIRLKAIPLVSAQLKLHKRKHTKRTVRFSPAPTIDRKDDGQQEDSGEVSSATAQSSEQIEELECRAEKISLNEEFNSAFGENQQQRKSISNDCNLLGNSNKWMQYRLSDGDYTKEEWDKLIFIDKPYIGFYDWPKELKVYEPYEKQPQLDRSIEDMNEFELVVYEKFTDSDFVAKFVDYICLEDKGNPENRRFDNKRPSLFKGLFRNYGPCMLEPFRKYIDECTTSTCEQKQKFVIEYIAGLMRGSKHWSYEMLKDLKQYVLNIIEKMTISQENFNDWTGMANFVFRNRDVKRLEWLMNYLVTKATAKSELTSPTVTPFVLSSRLTLAQYSLIQCQWRAVDHIFPIVAANLRSQDDLLIYANVRSCLASIFSLIFMFDDQTLLSRIPGTLADGPKRVEFIEFLIPKLSLLEKKSSSTHSGVTTVDLKSKFCQTNEAVVDHEEHIVTTGGSTSRYIVDEIQATESANTIIESLAISETTGDSDMVPIISMDATPESPSASGHHHTHDNNVHRAADQSKADKTNVGTSSSTSTNDGPFVDNLRDTLPELNLSVPIGSLNCDLSNQSEERKNAVKLMKLTSTWIIFIVYRMRSCLPADFFKLLPLICEMNRDISDPELAADSLASVAVLGSSLLSSEAVVESLNCVRKIIADHSWHARVAAAAFIEIMVSSNFFKLLSVEKWRSEIEDIVINRLICDDRIEVRESSSLTLSGLIHCEFTKITQELLNEFKQRASEPLIRRKQPNGTNILDSKSMVRRHSGILCLCACVDAYPYTVPDYLPDILTLLSDHLADPQPISTTIKKTMSNFRRTHHDNWKSDKTKFTEDQLSILADLLVSPSYYA